MGPLGMGELVVIFVLALLVFGPKKLPELGRTFGKGMAEFKRASNELKSTFQREMDNIERETRDVKDATRAVSKDLTNTYYDDNEDDYYSDYDYDDSSGSTSGSQSSTASPSSSEAVTPDANEADQSSGESVAELGTIGGDASDSVSGVPEAEEAVAAKSV